MRRRGLTARMIVVSAVMLAVVATAFTTLLGAIGDLRGSTRWTEHSVGVLAAASALHNVTSDFSSATRNYVDNPDQTQLQHWGQLRLQVSAQADGLVRSVTDNPVQTLTARAIRERIRSLQADWASPLIALAGRPETLPRALEIAQGNSGRTRVAAIRVLFEHFNAREKALGLARGKAARAHAHQAAIIAVVSLAALVLAIVVLAVLLARTVSLPVRRIAIAAAKVGRGDLSARVPEGGQAEIGDLAHAFNTMAMSLRDQRDELETQNSELEAQQVELEEALDGLAAERDEVDGFRRFIELVSREQDPDRLADTILKELCEVVGAPVGTLYGVDDDHGSGMVCLAALGVDRSRLPEELLPGEGLAGRAIVERQIVNAAFGDGGLRFESFGQEVRLSHEMHIPLVHAEGSVGVVTIGRSNGHQLTAAELERVRYFAAQAAVGLSHASALRRARNQAAINRAVLDSAHDAYIAFDDGGAVTAWSPRAEATFGWSALESVGRQLVDLIVPVSDREAHRKSIARFLRGAGSPLLNRRLELTARHKDGHDFPVEVAISPIELDGSWQFNAFIHDITERRLLEARSGRLFDISLDLMCTFTPDGHLQQINQSWSNVLGWSEEELLDRPMADFLHPDDVQPTIEASKYLLENRREIELGVENRWRAADGSYHWLTWSAHLSPEENLIYAVAKDVTESKQSGLLLATRYEISEALSHSDTLEEDLTAVLAAAARQGWEFGAAWLPDEDGREMYCASTWASEGTDPARFEKLVRATTVVPDTGAVGTAWHTGEAAWLDDAVAIPLVGSDGVVGVIQLLAGEPRARDEETVQLLTAIGDEVGHVVERRIARIETDRMKDDFLALVSHELRTPLTSIVGYLELLTDEEDDSVSQTGRQFLSVIERNAHRLQRLVDDVLFATRAETGKMALADGRVDLRSVAADSVETARPKADERGVSVLLDATHVPQFAGDPDRLGQALDNLISNALKFTPPGGRVDVVLRKLSGRAALEVRDTGLGMSAEDQAQVFDRFFRAAATRDHAPGVGLGLTIVKAIVEGHGGTVDVDSTEGAGTTFRIELPLAGSAERAQSSPLPGS